MNPERNLVHTNQETCNRLLMVFKVNAESRESKSNRQNSTESLRKSESHQSHCRLLDAPKQLRGQRQRGSHQNYQGIARLRCESRCEESTTNLCTTTERGGTSGTGKSLPNLATQVGVNDYEGQGNGREY